ncbi:hypothetical protein CP532_1255 [Ophiocordyceps camponoti-leonardi (nom. inval.)]|nr:hypothetical protein CP532_1255 [Ophiocordyceps camponoti-leonardi (nom. inval.)]
MARLSVPTKARLPSSLRVAPTNRAVVKSLSRLSRESLLSIALDWLEDGNLPNAAPYLVREADADEDDPDHLYPPCRSIAELRDLYRELQSQKGSKRDVVSRILEGDWRHGLTLYQLAMIDCAHFEEHPTSHNWSAYAILPLKLPSVDAVDEEQQLKPDKRSLTIPRFHPSSFLQKLQDQVLPDVKAHYHFYRPRDYPVLLLRVFVIDSPYNTSLALSAQHVGAAAGTTSFAASRTVYLAFPDGSPSLYITRSQSTGPISLGESKSLHGLIVNGVPKALSQPRQRFVLRSTNLSSRNLYALLDRRGGGRGNAAAGGWSIYADERVKDSPLDTLLPRRPLLADPEAEVAGEKRHPPSELSRELKRAKLVAEARFANEALVTDGKGVERVDILMQDPFPIDEGDDTIINGDDDGDGQPPGPDAPAEEKEAAARQRAPNRRRSKLDVMLQQARADEGDGADEADASCWTPAVRLSFQGTHVFAGIRQLVEAGVVDGERMPGWMTGEEGVTTGVVRHGRVRGYRGAGI